MLIDDEKTILHGILNLLDWSSHGYQIKGAFSNPLEALDFFSNHPIDIVVTDLVMPELNGIVLSRLLKEKNPDVQILVLSSHDDFQLVKDSFKEGISDYLLKPKLNPENLLSALNHLVKKKRNSASSIMSLNSALTQYFSGQDTALTSNYFHHSTFFLIYGENEDLSHLRLLNKNKVAFHSSVEFFPFVTIDHEYGCLVNVSSIDRIEKIKNLLEETAKEKDHLLIISTFFNFAELFDGFKNLKKIGKGQRFYQKNAGVISQEHLLPLIPHYEQSTKSYLTKIVNKDYVSAIREIKSTIDTLIALKISPLYLKHETINRLYVLINAMEDEQENNTELTHLKITLPTFITNQSTIEAFSKSFTKTINQLMDWIAPQPKENSAILTAIYEYVQENYQQDLTLQMIAEKFHFSYSYLSTIFTEKYGISFTKYLKKVRIQHAKRLLIDSKDTLSEISYKVGFADLGYFSRVFKEETGISPSHYRKGKLNNEEKVQRI